MVTSTPTSTDDYKGEVVGANGRIGSFLLRSVDDYASVSKEQVPGSYSQVGSPILVAVPATQISSVIDSTPISRRNDLIFVTNGIPSDFLINPKTKNIYDGIDKDLVTTSVPHFGVLGVGSDPISNESSPPTFIHGKNAKLLDDILSSSGLNTSIVQKSREVDAKAIRKLLWVSTMWLLCHDSKIGNTDKFQPLTVKQVHEQRGEALNDVLEELLPVANLLLQKYYPDSEEYSCKDVNVGSMEEVSKYMQDYSFSMPTAIPNKILAIDEFAQRNGNLLGMKKIIKQPLHEERIMNVVGFIPREGY